MYVLYHISLNNGPIVIIFFLIWIYFQRATQCRLHNSNQSSSFYFISFFVFRGSKLNKSAALIRGGR